MTDKIVALGELLVDFSPLKTEEADWPAFQALPGGAPGNFLAACQALGHPTAFIGAVGQDIWGQKLIMTLAEKGISTEGIQTVAEATTLAFVILDEHGERDFSFVRNPGADTCLELNEMQKELIKQAQVFHFGSLSMTAEPARTATGEGIALARENKAWISFDPNYRAPLWSRPEEAGQAMAWGYRQADSMKIGLDELAILFPEERDMKARVEKLFSTSQLQVLWVTNGADGSYYFTRTRQGFVPAFRNSHVIDTTGAGDIFCGSVIGQLAGAGLLHGDFSRVEDDILQKVTRKASMFSSLSTLKRGGIASIPSEQEVDLALQGLTS